jgi:hypothetical protein
MVRATLCATIALLGASVATAGSGWYLLSPMVAMDGKTAEDSKSAKVLADDPLSKWHHGGSFDSARECNAERERNWQKAFEQLKLKDKATRPWMFDAFFVQASAARCVASDDPRLK